MGFGGRLRQKRKEAGLTQEELGRGLGTDGKDVGKAVVYGWEKEQHFPKVDQLEILCRRYRWSADFLVLDQVGTSDLAPDVAELVSEMNDLPAKHRDWVLMTLREAVKLAREMVADNVVGQETHAPDARNIPYSSRRTKAG